ncbi:phosphoribosylanthranilate isomerase [Pelistega ratti]|uniref:phosphoribosylanthranilate isomerase n=1 Tax=Pelistega ratti TaxID=2652177 RepID=UPI00135C5024|nr:phosphoribosylanthranilate isomerase [Pelistega ratti]
MKVKICGLRQVQEIQLAEQLGVDAIGLVLYPKSKRALTLAQAKRLRAAIPDTMQCIVLLVNPSVEEVNTVIAELKPSAIQFHGNETGEFCEQFQYPYWRAVRVGAENLTTTEEIQAYIQQYPHSEQFLFDAYSSEYGGAGIRFNLDILKELDLPLERMIIAGGIHEGNVGELLDHYAFIDLSSGVEEIPGVKSLEKMERFMQKVHKSTKKNIY